MATSTRAKKSDDAATDANRARLCEMFLTHQAASRRVQQLSDAVIRANDESREAYSNHVEADRALRHARQNNPKELAEAYVTWRTQQQSERLKEAEAKRARAEAEMKRIDDVEAALQSAVKAAESDLVMAKGKLYEAFAALVCAAPAFKELCADITHAWFHLRTLREVFGKIQSACHG